MMPPDLKTVGIEERLGARFPQDLSALNQEGVSVSLDSYFKSGRPVILNLAYYSCPMLCHFVATGLAEGLKQTTLKIGEDYDVISVSFDPEDTVSNAKQFSKKYQSLLGQPLADSHWSFLIVSPNVVDVLTDSVGFSYFKTQSKTDRFAHSSAIVVFTPDGRVSRYLYGISFSAFDLKMAISEAKLGHQKSTVDKLMLFCYNYDPQSRKYVFYAVNLMKAGGILTVVSLVGLLLMFRRKR